LVENKEDISAFANYTPVEKAKSATASPPQEVVSKKEAKTSAPVESPSASTTVDGRVFASPIAKKLAAEKNIPLSNVSGSGPNGRVIKSDVEGYKVPQEKRTTVSAPTPTTAAGAAYEDIPVSNIRRVIAQRLTDSKTSIPHYYLTVELNADKILKLRELLNKESNGKFKLSVNDFIIKASALALRDVPEVNSSWQESFIRQYQNADIAVAVATETGLITPIINQAQNKGLSNISNEMKTLANKAKANKLAPHEYQVFS
jgi:pyruvate dehydrogenase E2 component (dihydrolipoamide acetyltransferase)